MDTLPLINLQTIFTFHPLSHSCPFPGPGASPASHVPFSCLLGPLQSGTLDWCSSPRYWWSSFASFNFGDVSVQVLPPGIRCQDGVSCPRDLSGEGDMKDKEKEAGMVLGLPC